MPGMDPAELRKRFTDAPVARMATLRADGTPRLVPVTFAVVGERVFVGIDDVKPKSGRRLARLADVDRDPRVALLVDRYAEDWSQLWWVRVDGRATVHEDGPVLAGAATALRAKYPQYARATFTAVVAVEPTAWTGWSARA
ncbi:PPOX class probable F420-dependent enzyme, Rv0121 family [Pseudonocardia thermophila]|uniref:PPOX class probable F420-dependent enzyme, Rv0121 family n=2 Tax=Pseudonocardia thermophila TaxID=1848 RepID=A0A1M6Z210_PSETH|nr:PPOX class probable F420-dependent enzyme, Rv0121 family [Pseudonocardia thermophila]